MVKRALRRSETHFISPMHLYKVCIQSPGSLLFQDEHHNSQSSLHKPGGEEIRNPHFGVIIKGCATNNADPAANKERCVLYPAISNLIGDDEKQPGNNAQVGYNFWKIIKIHLNIHLSIKRWFITSVEWA